MLSGIPLPSTLCTSEITRIRSYVERLRSRAGSEELISSWLHDRADHVGMSAPRHLVADLLTDARLSPSGVSDPRISARSLITVEGYVSESDVTQLVTDYQLTSTRRPNVILHVVRQPIPHPVPIALSLADLADHQSPALRPAFQALLLNALALADDSRKRARRASP